MSKQKETLTFNDFTGYYGAVPDGYGGFDWSDIDYINNDAIRGRGEACFGSGEGGSFESANMSESFSLKSMLVASGAETRTPVFFISYTYSDGKLTVKARDVVYVTPQVQKVDFATLGAKGDFKNIVRVDMEVGSARYGSHYGHDAIGNGMLFDNMTVVWNGKIPDGRLIPSHRAFFPPHIAHAFAANSASGVAHDDSSSPGLAGNQYHSALTSLDVALGHTGNHGGLTGAFVLPEPDHFGT
jgi:hypothetical protein